MHTKSRLRSINTPRTALLNFYRLSRFGPAVFALVFIALTAAGTARAQKPTPTPQRRPSQSKTVQLPVALRNRVVVAHAIIGKGFATMPTTGNKQAHPQPLTTAQRSKVVQMAKSGKMQTGTDFAMAKQFTGGSGFNVIAGLTATGASGRPAPLTKSDKLILLQYVVSTPDILPVVNIPDSTTIPVTIFNKATTNLVLSPSAPFFPNAGALIFHNAFEVDPSKNLATLDANGSLDVWFNPPAPGLYILHCDVRGWPPGEYPMVGLQYEFDIAATENPSQKIMEAIGQDIAIPIQVNKGNAWYWVKISSQVRWFFSSCEVISAQ